MFRVLIVAASLYGLAIAAPIAVMAQDANATLMLICDRAAGSPGDKLLPAGVPGVGIKKIDHKIAVPACEVSAKAFPDQPRLAYQLGRAYFAMQAYDQSLREYLKAYEQGYKRAAANIGALYRDGKGVARDNQETRRWYERGAEAGDTASMDGMGWLYLKGLGVAQDYQEARRWFGRAADAGDAVAMGHAGWLYHQGLGVRVDYFEARRWYERGAAGGDSFSMGSLGFFFDRGLGGRLDRLDACLWYKRAADLGDTASQENARTLGCR
jgi:TPR repeat protein